MHIILNKLVDCLLSYFFLLWSQGFITGGKDGKVALWDEQFEHCLKTYQLHSSAVETGGWAQLHTDLPAVRALSLGQNKILVGTKTSEVKAHSIYVL